MKLLKHLIPLIGGLLLTGLIAVVLSVTFLPGSKTDSGKTPLVVTIKAKDMQFDISTITVKVGQPITLRLENDDTMDHGIAIDALFIRTDQIGSRQVTSVTFTPEKTGTYQYHCFVNAHAELGMVGILQVVP